MRLAYSLANHSARFETGVSVIDHATAVSRAGFRLVEIDDWTLKRWEASGGTASSLAQEFAALELACLTYGPLRVRDEAATLAAMAHLAGALEPLSPSWIPVVVYSTRSDVASLLRRCADQASELNVGLAVEFVPWTGLADLAAAQALVAEIGRDSVRLLVDLFHLGREGGEWSDIANLRDADLAMIQLSDRLGSAGEDPSFESSNRRVLPGQGVLDLSSLFETLRATGWDGAVSLEILSAEFRSDDPGAVARAAWQTTNRLLAS
jgi:sugar phosphate isomerase/epimerase